ncbi:hypothetical protein DL546_006966 [Coniochaeta pulveracea]|uniref:NADH-ubiquinone oxidoreductase 21.3 kDa subunit n=1 Tax=Coniochaeta pulveracea TaxID=177199 RepID=A0A420YCE3_9PEZI|nr:hypothetical protein DL546_006966 [Coniochaeta pulveracea]
MAPQGVTHIDNDHDYHPKDAIRAAGWSAGILGTGGLVAAAVQSAVTRQNIGPFGAFTKFGGTIATWTAVGGTFEFTRVAAANLREKDDHLNSALGGFAAGAILGMQTRRMPRIIGIGAVFGLVLSVMDYTGRSIKGNRQTQDLEEFDRKEYLRKNRRRPLEETIAEVGEGRSIRPPGYEERRRQRLLEKYGFEVNPVSADPNAQ